MIGGQLSNKILYNGSEAAIKGCLQAGATFFAGYPITPGTEIMEQWVKKTSENQKYRFIQAEDETSAGFNVIGAILAGKKAFTATAGPGNTLMQDPISMAEAMRLPFVAIIMQRGGPSTGTVIFSQQEVNLTCHGGNGEGHRIVYSTSTPQELYNYCLKAFDIAWKWRFPTFILADGYQAKQESQVVFKKYIPRINSKPILKYNHGNNNLRNCYNFETELALNLEKNIRDYNLMSKKVCEYELYKASDASEIIITHGITSLSVIEAIDILRTKFNKKIGLFRPITLAPFPIEVGNKVISNKTNIYIAESSNGQLASLVKSNLNIRSTIVELLKPAVPISAEDIINLVRK